jgi:glycosyltransferase involved in cell wall biosynthesis
MIRETSDRLSAPSSNALLVGPLPPPHGGRATYTRLLGLNLIARGWDVQVLDTGGGTERAHKLPHVAVPTRVAFLRSYVRASAYPVLVTASDRRPAGYPFLAVLVGRIRRQRVVVNVLSGRFAADMSNWSALTRLCRRLTLRLADGVVACNQELVDAVESLHVPRSKLHLAGCLLPRLEDLEGQEEAQVPLPEFIQDHQPLLVAVGSFRPVYRLWLAVEAVPRIRAEFPSAGLVVVTSGGEDDAEKKRFLGEVARVGREHVAHLREVANPQLLALLDRCDVFLRLTTHDGDSVSLQEALARGIRCVATDTGHRPASVVTVREPTPEAVSDAVGRALRRGAPRPGCSSDVAERNIYGLMHALRGGRT